MTTRQDGQELQDVKQLGMFAAIASLAGVFWIFGGLEMIERLAYYGVRCVTPLYFKRPVSEGALGVGVEALAIVFLVWGLIQSTAPIFTGGIADRYGYKRTIAISTAIKTMGYVLMALLHSYHGFVIGMIFLAIGTAIFKPGIQGMMAKTVTRENSSVGWGIFYQTVNIGGWIGPLIALSVREHMTKQFSGSIGWSLIFWVNAAFICLNFLLLLTFKEPGKEEREAQEVEIKAGRAKKRNLLRESLVELRKPQLYLYLAIFCVWWFMFPMIWDVLPAFVDDWVNTSVVVTWLFGAEGVQSGFWKFILASNKEGTLISPEGITNLNSGMIMITCVFFAAIGAKMRALTSMAVGTVLATSALFILGSTNAAWMVVFAMMIVFSIGEMLSSPKFSEFLGNIAPSDKKGMWMGFSQIPVAIGMTAEGYVGPKLYAMFADKDQLAREMLIKLGMHADKVTKEALPIGEAFKKLVEYTGKDAWVLTQQLYENHHIGVAWYFFGVCGVFAVIGLVVYGAWLKSYAAKLAKAKA